MSQVGDGALCLSELDVELVSKHGLVEVPSVDDVDAGFHERVGAKIAPPGVEVPHAHVVEVGEHRVNDLAESVESAVKTIGCVAGGQGVAGFDGDEVDVWIDEAAVVDGAEGVDVVEPRGYGCVHGAFALGEDDVEAFAEVVVVKFLDALKVVDAGGVGEETEGRVFFLHAVGKEGFDLAFPENACGDDDVGLH